jgi:uncharacterized protein
MKFVNRYKEMNRLNQLFKSEEAEVAVVWGRRRMGKTRLLIEWANKHKGVYYTADESAAVLQRKYFSLAIEHALPGFSSVEYPDWTTLFNRLAIDALHVNWRGPLIIDELPYLISTSPELPSVLQRFIDHEAKKARLIIALCGSSQRMMQGAILDASAPLFGRAKEIIKLGPIPIGYMEEALGIEESKNIIETYAIFGGIPRYWELIRHNGKSLLENIDDLVLDPMGPLSDEPNRLLLEESSMSLRPILDAIGLGAHRLSEVAARIGKPVTSFSRMLQNLLELDLIEREIPFKADEQNSKRTLYKIKDPFMRFWFKIVAPQRSFFSQSASSTRRLLIKNNLQPLFSIAWEELCRSAISNFTYENYLFGGASRYWHKSDVEWDILSESADGKALLIGEAKWLSKTPTAAWIYKTIEELQAKGLPPESKHLKQRLFYVLFVSEKPKSLNLPLNVKVIDSMELIKYLK